MIEDRWLSVAEIAASLGVKRDTVYKWIERKAVPAHNVGRLWKFRKDEVDQWFGTAAQTRVNACVQGDSRGRGVGSNG